jgi:NAD-dependent dihydropyrimidine dehydrogenase PreA subunit
MDVLRLDEATEKAMIKYLRDCQACLLCEITCPREAIYVSPDYERRIPVPIYY